MKNTIKKHRTLKDFPNLDSAHKYLRELQGKVGDMQRKLDHAKYKAKAYKHFSDPAWMHRLGVALDCHKHEAQALSDEIVEHERKVRRKTADFYWHFYNAARSEVSKGTFDRITECAHITMELEG